MGGVGATATATATAPTTAAVPSEASCPGCSMVMSDSDILECSCDLYSKADIMSFPSLNEYCINREKRAREARLRQVWAEEEARGNVRSNIVCKYWLLDRCMNGDRCKWLHVMIQDKIPRCDYMEGKNCPDGGEKGHCIFRHYNLPGEKKLVPRYDPQRVMPGEP